MLKLSTKLIKGPGRAQVGHIVVHEDWVSNGHWIVRRSALSEKQQALTASAEIAGAAFGVLAEKLSDKPVNLIMKKFTKLVDYESTDWEYLGALYLAPVKGKQVHIAVNSYYWKALGFYGPAYAHRDPKSIIFDKKKEPFDVALMPMNVSEPPNWVQEAMAAPTSPKKRPRVPALR